MHVYGADGTWAATFTAGNFCGAEDSMTQTITVLPAPEFSLAAEPAILCVGEPTTLSVEGDPIGGHLWSFGDGITSSLVTPTHAYGDSGFYNATLTAYSTTNGCPATVGIPVEVLVTPLTQIMATPFVGCPPLMVNFLNTSTNASHYLWTMGDGNSLIGPAPVHTYVDEGAYVAQLLATNANGCADSTTANITVYPRPVADFSYMAEHSLEAILPVQFENRSTGAPACQWDLGDGTSTPITHPFHTYTTGAACSFSPMLVAYNQFGCSDTTTKTIGIDYDMRIWAPNAFRPDGDGLNDEFIIYGADIEPSSVHLMIFDRWGELIHETRGREPRWDGRRNGTLVKNDVYVWVLKARLQCGYEDVDKIGHVTVVR